MTISLNFFWREFSCVFFFQAEDGIRDIGVTGVQTCALPILVGNAQRLTLEDYRRQFETNVFGVIRTLHETLPALMQSRGRFVIMGSVAGHLRSEERRVGKECRSRWSPYH